MPEVKLDMAREPRERVYGVLSQDGNVLHICDYIPDPPLVWVNMGNVVVSEREPPLRGVFVSRRDAKRLNHRR